MNKEVVVPKIGSRWRVGTGPYCPVGMELGKIYTVDSHRPFPSATRMEVIHTVVFKELMGKRYDCEIFSGMEEVNISAKLELI